MNKDYIKLSDGTKIEIETSITSLSENVSIQNSLEDASGICKKLMAADLSVIEYYTATGETPYSRYSDMALIGTPTMEYNKNLVSVTVKFGFREKSEVEKLQKQISELQDAMAALS